MKKLFALILAVVMISAVFAACGSEPEVTEAPTAAPTAAPTEAEEAPTEEATEAGEKVVAASKMSNHENGWEVEAWSEGSAGVYFNMWTNDLPYDSDWAVRYQPHSGEIVTLIRDGQSYEIGGPGVELLVKFSANSYYLCFDKWICPDLFPLQENDVVVIEGDLTNPENGYTIHFDKVYIQLKAAGITKFTTEAPEGIEG